MARKAWIWAAVLVGGWFTASSSLAQHDLRREDMSAPKGANAYADTPQKIGETPGMSSALNWQNRQRLFSFHRPVSVRNAGRLPLVMVLHDGGGSPERMADITLINHLADRDGFMVVYPSAIDRFWNDGRKKAPGDKSIDDVGFLMAVRDRMIKSFNADPQRVYLVGLSEGGMMAMRLACESARGFAAMATVNASMPVDLATRCKPNAQIPAMMIAGTSDPVIPYTGGDVNLFDETAGKVLPVMETADAWRQNNGCAAEMPVRELPDRETSDGSVVRVHGWDKCRAGAVVQLYEIQRGGHTWPGTGRQLARLRQFVLGRPNMDFDATAKIWEFVSSFKRPTSPFDVVASVSTPAG